MGFNQRQSSARRMSKRGTCFDASKATLFFGNIIIFRVWSDITLPLWNVCPSACLFHFVSHCLDVPSRKRSPRTEMNPAARARMVQARIRVPFRSLPALSLSLSFFLPLPLSLSLSVSLRARLKSCPGEVSNACLRSAWGLWRIGRAAVLNEGGKEEGDRTLTPAGCGDSFQFVPKRRQRDSLGAAPTAFGTRRDKWNTNANPLNSVYICLPGVSRGILRTAKEWRKRCRDECCMVVHAPEGSPLLIKGPKRTKRRPWYFPKEDCKGGAIREGLMTGLLILSVHQKHQRVSETLGWKSGECLELFLVLYETGD